MSSALFLMLSLGRAQSHSSRHDYRNVYLIHSVKFQIGVGMVSFRITNSEELQIGTFSGTDPRRGIGIGIDKRNLFF